MRNSIYGLLIATFFLLTGCCKNGHKQNNSNGCVQNIEKASNYLVAYMKGTDEHAMYYAIADSGTFLFREINSGKPIVQATMDDRLLRDPMILQDKNGIYHLVATVSWHNRPFTIWDSKDLITWENERLVDIAPEGATKTWAPELIYDHENDQYMVYWTAEIDNQWEHAAIYFATTKDFLTWSETDKLYGENNDGILDANISYIDGKYVMLYRYEQSIWKITSDNAIGPYSNREKLVNENVEGPWLFPLIDGGYGLVFDYYGGSAGFGMLKTTDFAQWKRLSNDTFPYYNEQVCFPSSIRHGSVLPITASQEAALRKAFP